MTPYELILAAFAHKLQICIHELSDVTGLDAKAVAQAVKELQREGSLQKVGDGLYQRKGEAYVSLHLGLDKDHLPALFGLDEREARNRVSMLKRMKERLVIDYHPILDMVIGDYESGLRKVEAIRYGADGA